jgi:hypothetical protein
MCGQTVGKWERVAVQSRPFLIEAWEKVVSMVRQNDVHIACIYGGLQQMQNVGITLDAGANVT